VESLAESAAGGEAAEKTRRLVTEFERKTGARCGEQMFMTKEQQ
jgi:hypothetical protein